MNSLQTYKDQCYNIGSPSPTPEKSPLKIFPKNLDLEFEFPKSKPPCHSKTKPLTSKIPLVKSPNLRKRKIVGQDSQVQSAKKPKMMSAEEVSKFFEEQRRDNAASLAKVAEAMEKSVDARMDGFSKKLDSITKDNAESNHQIQLQVTGLQEQMTAMTQSADDHRIKFEEKLVQLEGKLYKFQEDVNKAATDSCDNIEQIVQPIVDKNVQLLKSEMMSPLKANWNAMQAEKVHEHEHSLVIFGYNATGNLIEAAGNFLTNHLKISADTLLRLSVKQAHKLGKGSESKPAPLLIKFGNPGERNTVLTHSKNLTDKKIKMEKHIPKNYQDQYKIFKEVQFTLKNMPDMELKTQIVFDGHLLVLRVRAEDTAVDKFHWTIYDSWSPPMDSKSQSKSTLKTPAGTKPTPALSAQVTARANSAFLMNIKGIEEQFTAASFKAELGKYLSEDHVKLIIDVKTTKKKDLYTVYCNSWAAAKMISTSYTAKLNNHEVSFVLFSKDEPKAVTEN